MLSCGFSAREFFPVDRLSARKKLGLEKDFKYILQLGRMVQRKGIDNVIRAIALLSDKYPLIRLLVVGGDEPLEASSEYNRLRGICESLGIGNKVIFTGQKGRQFLKYYYSAADIFVTTPWYEPFGITPLEAMACGTPVIGAAVGGIQYTVKDGVTGY